ncbi:MAG: FecR domain-containing protein [Rhodospirillales bacterium]|nr:FecR domain-containing protein [Rhodospirillales bacterium]
MTVNTCSAPIATDRAFSRFISFGLDDIPHLSVVFFALIMTFSFLAPATALAQAAEAIGSVLKVKGTVDAIRDGTGQVLKKEDPVFIGDVIQTSLVGSIVLKLLDDSLVSLDAESQIVLDDMVYDSATGSGQIAMNAVQGVFSFVSGKISANTSSGMNVRSPSMTIGIRGTVDLLKARPAGLQSVVINKEGRSTARNRAGAVNLVAGELAETSSPDQAPQKRKSTPEDEEEFKNIELEVADSIADPAGSSLDSSDDGLKEEVINKTPYRPSGKATGKLTQARTTSGAVMVSSNTATTSAGSTSGGSYPSSIVCTSGNYYFKITSGPTMTAGTSASGDHDMRFNCSGGSSYVFGPDASPQSGNVDTDLTFTVNGVTFDLNFSVSGNTVTINKFE